MATLYGRQLSRADALAYVGDITQLGGVELGELADGRARGLRTAYIRTGSGLDYHVLIDRALDLGRVTYNGAALSWQSAMGWAVPTYYEPHKRGWLRTFGGGMMTTCGLTHVGPPGDDGGEELGLHGRISHLPASDLSVGGAWHGDDYAFWLAGDVRQAVLSGENLRLHRRLSGQLGDPVIHIHDTVENMGSRPVPFMLLYHCNFGFPLLSESATILMRPHAARPVNDASRGGLDAFAEMRAPDARWQAQAFYHDLPADRDGWATVALVNRAFNGGQGLGVEMRYDRAALPLLAEWKQLGAGEYVVALEAANCHLHGRAWERDNGTLQTLEPGEQRSIRLEFRVLPDGAAIDAVAARLA